MILASASPRRLELLKQLGMEPAAVIPADIDETAARGEVPKAYALRMAREKAARIAQDHPDDIVLAADTVVACGRRILPKADTEEQAAECLKLLSGRRHRVIGGIAVAAKGKIRTRAVVSAVTFKLLSPAEIRSYLDSGEWQGKAGGYAIQGRAATLVTFISGSYSNIVGLSLYDACRLLDGAQ